MPFPNYLQLDESTLDIEDGIEAVRQSNGSLRVRRMWPVSKARMVIVHLLTDAQWAALVSHWGANATSQDTIIWRETGTTYTVRYVKGPTRRRAGKGLWKATFEVMEV